MMSRKTGAMLAITFPAVWLLFAVAAISLASDAPDTLPGTTPLTLNQPLDEAMVSGIDRYALRALGQSRKIRALRWNRDFSSPEAYAKSIDPYRARFRTVIGAVDPRIASPEIETVGTIDRDSLVARGGNFKVHNVRWQVLDGVTAEGLFLQPNGKPRARVIALPDADWTPEMFCGLSSGAEQCSRIPVLLAEQGVEVLVPTLISRSDRLSGHPDVRYTNQPHREFIYRMAFEMGRHVIGYEVQKVLAGVDLFEQRNFSTENVLPIGVVGVGEGGLLAFYSAAADPRIDAVLVSGYFQTREGVWEEPIYRNVWSLLTEFGDAEIAGLIAPRRLTVEACSSPEVSGPPDPRPGRSGGAAPGRIVTPPLVSVREEFVRAEEFYKKLGSDAQPALVISEGGTGPAGTEEALHSFLQGLKISEPELTARGSMEVVGELCNAEERQRRQFNELNIFTQGLLQRSDKIRDEFWKNADRSSLEAWEKTANFYRDYVWSELIGKLPELEISANPRTRKLIDDEAYTAYEVVLDVYPDVIAGGVLLLPKDLQPGEKRPVVVCQHGLEGTPMDTITADGPGYKYYKSFSVELAKRGFITYAPQNPYRGQDTFRTLQRKSNPMKRSLFSYIIRQHEQTLDWLASLPHVDPERIGFYGLSYGGKTAVRVPPIVTRYALSICSADFNEWVRKNVSSDERYSYVFTPEYEMFEWNMGHVANYAELASLMTPRPFMVERGHHDGVAPDEWVAWEYSKVRRHYDILGIGEQSEIEFFNGPHSINGMRTFDFLHRHLDWPHRTDGR
jgi:dienelactone hydrolase